MALFTHLRTSLIVAPSTSVGKSIFATGLCRASLALGERVGYLKPVGTGSGDGDDEAHIQRFAPGVDTACLFHFDEPVSPHLAVQRASGTPAALSPPTDSEFASAVARHVVDFGENGKGKRSAMYIESAGGVHSPTLSGTSQLDAFRPLLPPAVLIASHELGGISTTISAYESLLLRGYDVDAVLVFREDYYRNFEYFESWFRERGIRVGVIDKPPAIAPTVEEDQKNLDEYYRSISEASASAPLQGVVESLQQIHQARMAELASGPRRAIDTFWYPFCQHSHLKNDSDIMVIDSAHGDFFSVFRADDPSSPSPSSTSLLRPVFDGSASWWTQALGHAHPELTLAAAQASGRYGHVIFPSATSVPSLTLSERLLSTVGEGWASRVFFSDDGSTGMEVGLKMALRSYAVRHGLEKESSGQLAVLGLKGSYHGDTIGAMDACEGNIYNDRVEWYRGRGLWLDPPTLKIENGEAVVRSEKGDVIKSFRTLSEVYDIESRVLNDPLAEVYRKLVESDLKKRYEEGGIRFGALILEPVVMGAGGMIFVDPLYQRVLVDTVRNDRDLFPDPLVDPPTSKPSDDTPQWRGLPVIFDEVFVGLRRLGRPNGHEFLGPTTKPDISCYAKILTGGLLPMAVTLASDNVFQAFYRPEKVDALLHGHSYTAHPVGCTVANKTLDILDGMAKRGAWDGPKGEWAANDVAASVETDETVWSLWSSSFVNEVSSLENVEGVMALGTVLSIYLRAGDGAGYASTAAQSLLAQLREGPSLPSSPNTSTAGLPFNVHARPLGNVIYFMSSLNSTPETLRGVEKALLEGIRRIRARIIASSVGPRPRTTPHQHRTRRFRERGMMEAVHWGTRDRVLFADSPLACVAAAAIQLGTIAVLAARVPPGQSSKSLFALSDSACRLFAAPVLIAAHVYLNAHYKIGILLNDVGTGIITGFWCLRTLDLLVVFPDDPQRTLPMPPLKDSLQPPTSPKDRPRPAVLLEPVPPPCTLAKVQWAMELWITWRGIGWNWRAPLSRAGNRDPFLRTSSVRSFLKNRLLHLIMVILVTDAYTTIQEEVPRVRDFMSGRPGVSPLLADQPILWRALFSILVVAQTWQSLELVYDVMALGFVGMGSCMGCKGVFFEPWGWPPLLGGMGELWVHPGLSLIVFCITGLLHEGGNLSLDPLPTGVHPYIASLPPIGSTTMFFILQPFAVAVEALCKSAYRRWKFEKFKASGGKWDPKSLQTFERALGFALVWWWLGWSASWVVEEWSKRGFYSERNAIANFSVIRGIWKGTWLV
ncbi:hypothetical protein MNV49_006642 [Pseudohyphozyma bogoriensis]|nr:hypothetical protein MNV49_006642 [Pseudohyphozyma bogoriensis]